MILFFKYISPINDHPWTCSAIFNHTISFLCRCCSILSFFSLKIYAFSRPWNLPFTMGRSVTIKDFVFHLLPWLSCMSVTLPQSSLNQLLTCVLKPKTLNCLAIILIGVSTDCSPTLQPTWIGRGSHLVVSGTLKRCSLHGWILVFTIQDRWQTACEVLYWWCLMYVRGYGMGRGVSEVMVWAGVCYGQRTQGPFTDPEAHCCAIHLWPSPHVAAW